MDHQIDGKGPSLDEETCELHQLCSNCRAMIAKVFRHDKGPPFSCNHYILHDPIDVPEHLVEEQCQEVITQYTGFNGCHYKLHDSIESLTSSVASRCHLCTLIWERIHSCASPRNYFKIHDLLLTTKADKRKTTPEGAQEENRKVVVVFNTHGAMDIALEASHDAAEGHRKQGALYRMGYYHKPSTFEHRSRRFLSTASSAHKELARYWLNECIQGHPQCRSKSPGFRPTRLLFIPGGEVSQIRLDVFPVSNHDVTYFALSHCWGGATDILTLRRDNVDDLSKSIPIANLPKSFQDAIKIVASLRGQYLWIDSLCIMQDCPNDWVRESTAMGSIYENALCTISAHAAENCHGGCYATRDPLRYSPCKILNTLNHNLYAAIPYASGTEITTLRSSRLSSRGWTFQETLLSARILHFGQAGIYWSCREGYATEIEAQGSAGPIYNSISEGCIFGPSSIVSPDKIGPIQVLYKHFLDMSPRQPTYSWYEMLYGTDMFHQKSGDDWANAWVTVVEHYSKRSLTKPEDRIVALSAVAQRTARLSGNTYAAGLWKEHFLHNLLWFIGRCSPLLDRPEEYRGPSWSWASVDGEIRNLAAQEFTSNRPLATVISISVSTHEADIQHMGRIYGASCGVKGSLVSATELIGCYASLSGQQKSFQRVDLDSECYVYLYPDSTGCWPTLNKLYVMPVYQVGIDVYIAVPKKIVLGIILQIDESEKSGQRYQRVGAFKFFSSKWEALGGWHNDITSSTVLGRFSAQEVVIV